MQERIGRRNFRNIVFKLHTWLGLHLCIVLGLIFLSGTLLLYSPELTQIRHPGLWIAPQGQNERVTVGEIYDTAARQFPEGKIAIIAAQPRPWFGRPVYVNNGGQNIIAHISPYDGGFIGQQKQRQLTLRNLVRKLHDSLLVPVYVFHVAVNALSLVVLALVITGLITYRRFWKGLFRRPAPDAPARGKSGALHRLAAVWTAPFLIVSSLAAFVFFLNAVGLKARVDMPPPMAERVERLPQGFDGATLDSMVAACVRQVPDFAETGVKLPGNAKAPLRINGYDAEIGETFGTTQCFIDPATGEVAKIVRFNEGNWMSPVKSLAVSVHYGIWAGWTSIILWTLFGAGSTYLAWSGARVFASRTIEPGRSTLVTVIQGLGIFKWAYLLVLLGAIGLTLRSFL